ncbi:MAG: Vitamin K epoxide reductase, partial [Betaproteobacteria bacterium]|nr:Vitamin K epoxide reductase [Betaproteobacteria bacterium]
LFEASVERLPYVECTPDGRNGLRNLDCVTNDINDYPTWIIDGRRYTGVLPVANLAALSGFKAPKD